MEICPKCKCNIREELLPLKKMSSGSELKQKKKEELQFRLQRIEAMRRLAIIKLDKKNQER